MKTILFLPTQGPHLPRPGPSEQYDWLVQCRMAASLQRGLPGSVVYVPSAFHQAGSRSELDFYGEELRGEGVSEDALLLEPHGFETVEQCERALALARSKDARLLVITCYVHFPRVRYLLRGHAVEHCIAWGTPSAWLRFTHQVLGIGFRVIDALGLREPWKRLVGRRRLSGRQ